LQLLDVVRTAPVTRLVPKDADGASVMLDEVAVPFRKFPEVAIEGARSPY